MAAARFDLVLEHARLLAGKLDAAAINDRQLVDAYLENRDEKSFTALVQRHGPMVLGVCRRVLRDAADVEDVFQSTFCCSLARRARFANGIGRRLASWRKLRVAHKCNVTQARRQWRERQCSRTESVPPNDAITWNELRGILDDELAQMDARFRAPLILCFLEGQTQDEAARQLVMSKRTLRRRLERGRQLIRVRLARRGISLSAGLATTWLGESTVNAAVPGPLASCTVKAAIAFCGGPAGHAAISSRALALSQEVLASKLSYPATLLLAVAPFGAVRDSSRTVPDPTLSRQFERVRRRNLFKYARKNQILRRPRV